MADLDGKVAVVTGASRGIGQLIALRLSRMGASVALLARDEAALRRLKQQIEAKGGRSLVVPVDLGDVETVRQSKDVIERGLGIPSILINAAGIFGPIDLVQNSDPDAWVKTIMVNIVSAYLTSRAFVQGMISSGWGRIVNVSSAATLHEPGPINSAYGTSKAALNQFTRHLASELKGTGVTANVIHPGDVKTEMWSYIKRASDRLGSIADSYIQWANWVEETGGDDPEKAADLVANLMYSDINGRFLWIKDGLQAPIASWGDANHLQPWSK